MSKRIAAILIAFLMQLNALFGFGGAATPADPADSYYDRDSVVDVIVELEQPALLESVSNSAERDALVDSIESNTQYQSILQAQRSLRERIEQTFSDADFSESYNYSFVTNGISLAIPYRYMDALKKLPGVKDVTLSTSFAAPREAEETALDAVYQDADAFTGIEQAHAAGYTGKGTVVAILDTGFELGHEAFSDDVPSSLPSPSESCVDKSLHCNAFLVRRVKHSDHVFAEDVRLHIDLVAWLQNIQIGLGAGQRD